MKKINTEKLVRNILIVLTLISLIILLTYTMERLYGCELSSTRGISATTENNYINFNSFVTSNAWLIYADNFLLYIFALIYLVLGIKSKNERVLKVSFCIFSVLTTLLVYFSIADSLARMLGIHV